MRAFALLAAFAGLVGLTGCNGMVKNYDERKNTYKEVADADARQFVDDFDAFWLADRQYRLTQWHVR